MDGRFRRDDAALIRHRLKAHIDHIVQRFFPNAVRDGKEWRLGSIKGEAGNSLGINRSTGLYKDFTYGKGDGGGDMIDLIAHGLGSGDIGEAFAWARRFLNLDSQDPAELARAIRRSEAAEAAARKKDEDERQRRARAAQAHWLKGQPIKDTPAEAYLAGRGIRFAALGRYPGALRYRPDMMCPETRRPRPCLLAAVHDGAGRFVTCHRIFLIELADGRWLHAGKVMAPAGMVKGKKVFGPYQGGFIPCWRGHGGQPVKRHDPAQDIAVTEGLEDALSIALVHPHLRVLAAVSLSNIGNLQLPACAQLWLCADNDADNPTAQEQFLNAKAALAGRGHNVIEVRPPAGIKDFNDWLRQLQGAA